MKAEPDNRTSLAIPAPVGKMWQFLALGDTFMSVLPPASTHKVCPIGKGHQFYSEVFNQIWYGCYKDSTLFWLGSRVCSTVQE